MTIALFNLIVHLITPLQHGSQGQDLHIVLVTGSRELGQRCGAAGILILLDENGSVHQSGHRTSAAPRAADDNSLDDLALFTCHRGGLADRCHNHVADVTNLRLEPPEHGWS